MIDDALTQLLTRAGRREAPPAETHEAVYLTTLLAWHDTVRQRRRRQLGAFALAASLALAVVGLTWFTMNRSEPASIVAMIGAGEGARAVHDGDVIEASPQAGIVLDTVAGHALFLDRGTRVRFEGGDGAVLEFGRLYFVAAPSATRAPFTVFTPFGAVTHAGTRYAVTLASRSMVVAVREGEVTIETQRGRRDAARGTQVTIDEFGDEVNRSTVDTYGPTWVWADAMAPALRLDGRPLIDVLEEIAAGSGRELEFSTAAVEESCRTIELKGPWLNLPAEDRLLAVLVTTGLEAVENGDRILIRAKSEPTLSDGS